MSEAKEALDRAIRVAGSATRLAELLGVHKSTISDWRKARVPADRACAVEAATGVTRAELRPDLFAPFHAGHAAQRVARKSVTRRTGRAS
jgi:DNA-binding transcriptional regulator YdaS (Cro superfamily)